MPETKTPERLEVLPRLTRDCVDCGEKNGMKLQNPSGQFTTCYNCVRCGTMMTIPPPDRPW